MYEKLLSRFFGSFRALNNNESWLTKTFGFSLNRAGVDVTESTAISLSAVWGCTLVLSQTIASLPLHVYKRIKGGKVRYPEHPLYPILHTLPNSEMTSYQWRQAMLYNLCLHGNAIYEIQRNQGGQVIGIWPIPNSRVTIKRSDRTGEIIYKIRLNDGRENYLAQMDILHIKGLSSDGLVGLSPIQAGAEVIGIGLAERKSAAMLYENGSIPSGVIEVDHAMGDEEYERIKESWNRSHKGLDNAHRVAFLEEGMKFKQLTLNPVDAQLIESRKFTVEDIARFYRMPLHKIQNLDRATNNNIEQQAIEFLTDTILPWLRNIEDEFMWKLFTSKERQIYFAEFLVDGLARGDIKNRYTAYQIGRQNGWLSANEIREKENMNRIDDPEGDKYLVPLNMTSMDQIGGKINDKEKQ